MAPLLREAIERQPPDVGGSHTWVCGCVEFQIEGKKSVSLCNYHGGYEDALTLIAGQLELAMEMLNNESYGCQQRGLQASSVLEQIIKDCVVEDGQPDGRPDHSEETAEIVGETGETRTR
jgi:hypothetical protein